MRERGEEDRLGRREEGRWEGDRWRRDGGERKGRGEAARE